jgi:hypothetical protein
MNLSEPRLHALGSMMDSDFNLKRILVSMDASFYTVPGKTAISKNFGDGIPAFMRDRLSTGSCVVVPGGRDTRKVDPLWIR